MTRMKTKKPSMSDYSMLQAVCTQNVLPLVAERACAYAFTLAHTVPFPYLYLLFTMSMYSFYRREEFFFHFVKCVTKLMRKRIKFSTVVSSGEGRAVLGSLGGVANAVF